MKHVEVEYIESGTFQGGEEDVSMADIEYGETCIVLHKKDFEAVMDVAGWAQAVLTAWNVGTLLNESPLHLKLREVMIGFRRITEDQS